MIRHRTFQTAWTTIDYVSSGLTIATLVFLGGVLHAAGGDAYRLAPGDTIDVIVVGEPELSSDPAQGLLIAPDGRIGVPRVGSIEAAGRTCDEVAAIIRKTLEGGILVQPHVLVRLRAHRQEATVLGFVANPGRVPIPGERASLAHVLAAVGGILPTAGSMQHVIVTRQTGEVVEGNVSKLLRGDATADVWIGPGDVIYVPPTEQQANVFGYVAAPGRYLIREGERISDLIARAGGPLVGRAEGAAEGDLSSITLVRADGTTKRLDLTPIAKGSVDDDQNPLALPGDAIYVPELRLSVSVLGHVVSPGRLQLQPGDRISDALAAAGGPIRPTQVPADTPGADLANAVLYRASGEVMALRLDLLYTDPKSFNDLPVVDGDVIVVPEGKNIIEVSGYVQKPGQYPFRPGETVRGARAMAGGPLPNVGSTTMVIVRHADGSEEEVNLEKHDPPLSPGDAITVPYMRERVIVAGAVNAPGWFDWHEGDTLVSVLARAAGPAGPQIEGPFAVRRGNVSRVAILRREGDGYKLIRVEVQRFYRYGDPAGNPPVEPGDVVYVPTKSSFDFEALTRDLLLLPGLLSR